MNTVLLIQIAIIILVSMVLQRLSLSLGAPSLLALLAVGLLYGGFDTRWRSAKKVLGEASLLSTLGVVMRIMITFAY